MAGKGQYPVKECPWCEQLHKHSASLPLAGGREYLFWCPIERRDAGTVFVPGSRRAPREDGDRNFTPWGNPR